jgi:glycosyltransferase involved in cell wall biosynthesis
MLVLVLAVHALLWSTLAGNLLYLRRVRTLAASASSGRKLSVLVPARNEAGNLSLLVPAILNQTYRNLELIVYDDDSTDGTQETLRSYASDERLIALRGQGPPPGWVGKVAALYEACRHATGEIYLFLDADVRLSSDRALDTIVRQFDGLPDRSVMTAMPRLSGAGRLLVSLIPFTILAGLPWFLVRRTRARSIAALNGQCWMLSADLYHDLEPHEQVKDKVLEDVEIGRYLKRAGVFPVLAGLSDVVAVRMYESFGDAWRGFRKNAYLIMGGHPFPFVAYLLVFALSTWLSPIASVWLLVSAWAIKLICDRLSGIPAAVSLASPVSFMMATFLQLDSALAHWTGRVSWKGRNVTRREA